MRVPAGEWDNLQGGRKKEKNQREKRAPTPASISDGILFGRLLSLSQSRACRGRERLAAPMTDWTLSCHSHTQAVGVEQLHGRWCRRVVLQAPGLHVHVGWAG